MDSEIEKQFDLIHQREMELINKLNNQIEQFKDEIKKLSYDKTDLKYGFYVLLLDIIKEYKNNIVFWNYLENLHFKIESGKLKESEIDSPILDLLKIVREVDGLSVYYNKVKRSLLIDSWIAFESSLLLIFESYFDEESKYVLQELKSKQVKKLLTQEGIILNVEGERKLKKLLVIQPFAKVAFSNQFEYFIGQCEKKLGISLKKELDFFHFYRDLRNSQHSNFHSLTNRDDYNFNGIIFRFTKGEIIRNSDNADPTTFSDISLTLKDTYVKILGMMKN